MKAAGQPAFHPHGADVGRYGVCLCDGGAGNAEDAAQHHRRNVLRRAVSRERKFPAAHLPRRDSATQAAEARAANHAASGTPPRQNLGEHQCRSALELILRLCFLHSRRTGSPSQCRRQADSWDLLRRWESVSRSFSATLPCKLRLARPQYPFTEAVHAGLGGEVPSPRLESRYTTPGGVERALEIVLTPVLAPNAELLGAACLINDLSEIAQLRQQQQWRRRSGLGNGARLA